MPPPGSSVVPADTGQPTWMKRTRGPKDRSPLGYSRALSLPSCNSLRRNGNKREMGKNDVSFKRGKQGVLRQDAGVIKMGTVPKIVTDVFVKGLQSYAQALRADSDVVSLGPQLQAYQIDVEV